jgi:hypothetical protein
MIGKATLEDFPKAKRPINNHFTKYIWIHYHHLLNLLKDITLRSSLSTQQEDIDGSMD